MLEILLDECEYLYGIGDYPNLIEKCDEVLKIEKDEPASLNYKAISFYYLKRYDESLELLNYSLKLHHRNHYTLNNMALVYIALGDYEKALECCEEGLKSRDFDWLQINKIESLIHLNRIDEAREYYQSVKIPFYTFEEALDNCGISKDGLKVELEKLYRLFNEGKYSEVIRLADELGNDEKIINFKISALVRMKRFTQAVECVDEAIKSYPYNYNFHFLKARISVMCENFDEAIESYENGFEAFKSTSNNRLEVNEYRACLDIKARKLMSQGKHAEANEILEKISNIKK